MSLVHFYRLSDGLFIGRSFSGKEEVAKLNTPYGCGYIAGVVDWQSQRVNLQKMAS
jgi:hypothetical protein